MNDLSNPISGFIDIALILVVILFNYFVVEMQKILYGKEYRYSLFLKFFKDIKMFKLFCEAEDTSSELKHKCRNIIKGIYGSIGLLFFVIFVDILID
jgi:hypothetical protein